MKKFALLFALLLVLVIVSVASAESHPPICPPACDGEQVMIYPWRGDEVTIYSDQFVTLGARWGACKSGLVKAFMRSAVLDWEVDAAKRRVEWPESREEWSEPWADSSASAIDLCVMNTDAIWLTYFDWPLGTLEPGDHTVYLRYGLRFSLIDGIDFDEDGHPDRYHDPVQIGDMIIHVLER